jgi:hypothetical protein
MDRALSVGMRLLSGLIGLFMITGCGLYETPFPEDLAGEEVRYFASKQDKALEKLAKETQKEAEKILKDNAKAIKKGCTISTDPFADLMPIKKVHEKFEKLDVGAMPAQYRWLDAPGGSAAVTDEEAYEGKQSLKVVVPASASYVGSGVRFCTRCEVMERFKASFAIRFETLVSWNGLMVTNNPQFAYWWWVRSNGTVFDDPANTVAQLKTKTWYQVKIDIDRKKSEAKLEIKGDDKTKVKYTAPLDMWYPKSANHPMGCFRLFNIARPTSAQTVYIDEVKVDPVK